MMTPELYALIQKALFDKGELIASRASIEVIAEVAARYDRKRVCDLLQGERESLVAREDHDGGPPLHHLVDELIEKIWAEA